MVSTALSREGAAGRLPLQRDAETWSSPRQRDLMLLLERAASAAGAPHALVSLHARGSEPEILAVLELDPLSAKGVALAVEQQLRSVQPHLATASRFVARCAAEAIPLHSVQDWSCASVFADAGESRMVALTLCGLDQPRGHGDSDGDSVAGWATLGLRLWWQAEAESRRSEQFAGAFDLFNIATFLLEADGRILFANDKGSRLLDAGDGIRRSGESLTATQFEDAVRLQTAIRHGIPRLATSGGREAARTPLVLLHRAKAKPLLGAVFQLRREDASGGEPVSVLYVVDPDCDSQAGTAAICSAYGLTTAETRLVSHLVSGRTIAEAAEQMHVRRETARAYLKQIFAKTSSHRQADLVRIMLNSRLPIS